MKPRFVKCNAQFFSSGLWNLGCVWKFPFFVWPCRRIPAATLCSLILQGVIGPRLTRPGASLTMPPFNGVTD